VSSDLVKKLGLATRPHPHPYHIQWFNDKVTQSCRVSFSIGSYADSVDCDVVSMEALHHGRSNTYTFMHKGKKITLLPMTPTEIVLADKERAASLHKTKSENQQDANSIYPPKKDKSALSSKTDGIKLRGGVLLARKCDLAEISDVDVCYTLIWCANKHCFPLMMMLLARYLLLSLTFCRSSRTFFQLRYLPDCHL
jgi:hypothetical protein